MRLEELAIEAANDKHRRRLSEVKAMAAKLALLDTFLPGLAARGINLAARTINTLDKGETLCIQTPISLSYDDELLGVLIEIGFREVGRRDYRRYHVVALEYGRLRVEIEVTAQDATESAHG